MKNKVCTLCSFLTATKGNWRNSIYIECDRKCPNKELIQCFGFLMVPDFEGWPILIPANVIVKMTGIVVDKTECLTIMSRQIFESLYSSWLDWQVDLPNECAVFQVYRHTRSQCSNNMY